jgi:hypothetical protein
MVIGGNTYFVVEHGRKEGEIKINRDVHPRSGGYLHDHVDLLLGCLRV